MRVLGTDYIVAGDIVEFLTAETVHYTRWNAQRAQHHCHGGGKVFAMALLTLEKKIGQRIGDRRTEQLQRVSIMRFQISFYRDGFVIIIGSRAGNLCRQPRNAGIERWQL